MNVGLVTVATDKYIKFLAPLLASVQKHLLVEHRVTPFVFTNHAEVPAVRLHVDHAPWPAPTLRRFNMVADQAEAFHEQDYLLMIDADMLFVDTVGDEVLGDLMATLHPAVAYVPLAAWFPYERDARSRAAMAPNEGRRYYCGAFRGGRRENYLAAAAEIARRVDDDERRGVTAVWHDESHWNRYLWEHPPSVELSPAYCYPDNVTLPYPRKLLALSKNHAEVRS